MPIDTLKIRTLNDNFRRTFSGGRVHVTSGVASLPEQDVQEILHKVRTYDEFNSNNDPNGEHDFGSVKVAGNTIFWKIDYYDQNLQYGSENPAEPTLTTRDMTIMLSSEY